MGLPHNKCAWGEQNILSPSFFFNLRPFDKIFILGVLVDSGSDISTLPIDLAKPEIKMCKTFKGSTSNANINNISCVGHVHLALDLGFSKQFSWKFAVCKSLRQPILGADFLSQHSLLVDSANKRLLQSPSQYPHASKIAVFWTGYPQSLGSCHF